jgi:hypothetical protein
MHDCEKCKDLRVVFKIDLPSQLRKAINIANDNIVDLTISVVENKTDNWSQSFGKFVETGKWDDIVYHQFKCNSCGQRFQLNAETYHGSGGEWKPLPN